VNQKFKVGDLVQHENVLKKISTGIIIRKADFGDQNWIMMTGENKTTLVHEMNMRRVTK